MNNTENDYKGILHKEISKLSNINSRFHRVSSMLLDHFIMSFVTVPTMIIVVLLGAENIIELEDKIMALHFFLMMFIYFNKDFFNSKSPAKRILGYQVINLKTEKPATEFQCFIRNVTLIVWPLEVLAGYINPKRRIGDYIANTKVVTSEKEKLKTIFIDLKTKKWKLNSIVAILISGVIYFYGLSILIPSLNLS